MFLCLTIYFGIYITFGGGKGGWPHKLLSVSGF